MTFSIGQDQTVILCWILLEQAGNGSHLQAESHQTLDKAGLYDPIEHTEVNLKMLMVKIKKKIQMAS